ncbi:MAG TPA: zinc metalloprotease [Planctomycetota bacterium]
MLTALPLLTALAILPGPQEHEAESLPVLPCATHLVDAPQLACPDVDPTCDPNLDPTDPRFSCGLFSSVFEEQYDPPGIDAGAPVYQVQLVFHLIEGTDGRGRVSEAAVREQVRVLNEDFRALHATPGRRGVDVGIQFVLATRDPEGRPTSGITRSVNNRWLADRDQHEYSKALAWDVSRYVNVYVNEPPGFNGYVPWYPQQYIFRTFVSDRIVVRHTTVGRPGRVLTHEMGHYLGLRHVFEFGCFELENPWNVCQTTGDYVCDTPPTTPSSGCPTDKLACDGSPAPFRNYMDYSSESCQGEFTPQQANRMRCTLTTWRHSLARIVEPSPFPAEARIRNAGGNPYLLWGTEPWMGETMELFVRNRQHELVTLLASTGRSERALSAGTLLIDPDVRPLLVLGEGSGRVLSVPLRIPPSPSLVGRPLFVQALLHGGQRAQLTNAVDLRVGLRGVN